MVVSSKHAVPQELIRDHRPLADRTTAVAARATELSKIYGQGETRVVALDRVSVDFRQAEFTAIMGPSGSGKSTLMHCVAGLDTFSSGSVRIGDTELGALKDKQLTRLRRDKIGFIFQAFNLLPTLNALENITLPMDIAGRKPDKEWLDTVIRMVGLADRLGHRPAQLSGGQQQRVAVARALASRPDIVFGDEPTGNLDSRSGAEVLGFLRNSVRELGQTVVMVTHDPVAAAYADRVVFLADGRIVDELYGPTADSVLDRMRRPGETPRPPDSTPRAAPADPGPAARSPLPRTVWTEKTHVPYRLAQRLRAQGQVVDDRARRDARRGVRVGHPGLRGHPFQRLPQPVGEELRRRRRRRHLVRRPGQPRGGARPVRQGPRPDLRRGRRRRGVRPRRGFAGVAAPTGS